MGRTNPKKSLKKLDMLFETIDRMYPTTWELIWKNFLRGVFFGLGTTIGVTTLLAVATFTVSRLKLIPFIRQIIIQSNVENVLPAHK